MDETILDDTPSKKEHRGTRRRSSSKRKNTAGSISSAASPGHCSQDASFSSQRDVHRPSPRHSSIIEDDESVKKAERSHQTAVLVSQLRKASSLLMAVHPMLALVHDRTRHDGADGAAGDEAGTVAKLSQLTTVVPRSLEKLRVIRHSLDEALEVAEASSEDALLEATLKQHERALKVREQAESRMSQEKKNVEAVRCDVIELERNMLRSQRTHQRLAVDAAAQRLDEFERQRSNVENLHSDLTSDLHSITDSLKTQILQNGEHQETMRQICHDRDVAMEENFRANQLLASGETVDVYRKAKERERVAADTDFAEAQAECQTEVKRLREGWAATEVRIKQQMLELQDEVRSLQTLSSERQKEAERNLGKQASGWNKCSDDMTRQISLGMKALEDLRSSKAEHLHREALESRQRERDLAASSQRKLEVQINDIRLAVRKKLRMEEFRLEEEMKADQRSVVSSIKQANLWAKRADSMREAFRAHAYKSGAYELAIKLDEKPPVEFESPWTA